MGIQGLPKLIGDLAPNAIKTYDFSRFKGEKTCVDASLIIHKTVIAMRSNGQDLKNKRGELTSHLQGIFYKVLIFLQYGITPIFVFDGKAPESKANVIASRKASKKAADEKLAALDDSEDENYIKLFKQTFRPTQKNINEAKILLDLMGIPHMTAPGEADVVCSWLAARCDENDHRYVKGVCSDDSDMLAYGAPYLFKDMAGFMGKNKQVKVISLERAIRGMKMTLSQFTDMCALGSEVKDPELKISRIGLKTAYKLILKYKTLEKLFVAVKKKYNITDRQRDFYLGIRDEFANGLTDIDEDDDFVITDDNLELSKCQSYALLDFMCVKHNFDPERIKPHVDRLLEYNKIMNVDRSNTQTTHKIIIPQSKNMMIRAFTDELDFLSTSEDSNGSDDNDNDSTDTSISLSDSSEKQMPSKATNNASRKKANKLIARKKIPSNISESKSSESKSSESDMSVTDIKFEEFD